MSNSKLPSSARKKGGAQFPRINLKAAVEYAKKLVSKTHTGAQPASIILKGVFNNASSTGKIRASALKQFKLLQGESSAYEATPIAKQVNSAPPEDLPALLRRACLEPKIFKRLFDTFQNDTVSKAKIRQQALALGVHPDSGDDCVKIFTESLFFAQLAQGVGDDFQIAAASAISSGDRLRMEQQQLPDDTNGKQSSDEKSDTEPDSDESHESDNVEPPEEKVSLDPPVGGGRSGRAQMNITLSLDSTMDPEKLEKYMKILRRYGAVG